MAVCNSECKCELVTYNKKSQNEIISVILTLFSKYFGNQQHTKKNVSNFSFNLNTFAPVIKWFKTFIA